MGLQTMHAVEGDGEQTGCARFTGFTPWKEELENKGSSNGAEGAWLEGGQRHEDLVKR